MIKLDKILSTFNKTLKKLEALEAENSRKEDRNMELVSTLERETSELKKEREQAAKVRSKIESLIN